MLKKIILFPSLFFHFYIFSLVLVFGGGLRNTWNMFHLEERRTQSTIHLHKDEDSCVKVSSLWLTRRALTPVLGVLSVLSFKKKGRVWITRRARKKEGADHSQYSPTYILTAFVAFSFELRKKKNNLFVKILLKSMGGFAETPHDIRLQVLLACLFRAGYTRDRNGGRGLYPHHLHMMKYLCPIRWV